MKNGKAQKTALEMASIGKTSQATLLQTRPKSSAWRKERVGTPINTTNDRTR
jgi:hypothetical protein